MTGIRRPRQFGPRPSGLNNSELDYKLAKIIKQVGCCLLLNLTPFAHAALVNIQFTAHYSKKEMRLMKFRNLNIIAGCRKQILSQIFPGENRTRFTRRRHR